MSILQGLYDYIHIDTLFCFSPWGHVPKYDLASDMQVYGVASVCQLLSVLMVSKRQWFVSSYNFKTKNAILRLFASVIPLTNKVVTVSQFWHGRCFYKTVQKKCTWHSNVGDRIHGIFYYLWLGKVLSNDIHKVSILWTIPCSAIHRRWAQITF